MVHARLRECSFQFLGDRSAGSRADASGFVLLGTTPTSVLGEEGRWGKFYQHSIGTFVGNGRRLQLDSHDIRRRLLFTQPRKGIYHNATGSRESFRATNLLFNRGPTKGVRQGPWSLGLDGSLGLGTSRSTVSRHVLRQGQRPRRSTGHDDIQRRSRRGR